MLAWTPATVNAMKASRRLPLAIALALFAPALPGAAAPVAVLILSGQNNHDWKTTTPALQKILADSGRFTVAVSEHPEQCDAATFARYDVLLSNWNSFGKNDSIRLWPEATRAAFLDFVRSGRGLVTVHAGSSSFYDWPEYQQVCGAWWANGQTGHGQPHTFTVEPVNEHPVTRGLPPFTATDELWMKPGMHPAATIVATGDGQPVALATGLGKGRGFTLLLGHNAAFMENPGFRTLLLRGTEWAATGNATITPGEAALKSVASYQHGVGRSALLDAARLVQTSPREMAPRLAALLTGEATCDGKKFICEQLALCGSDAEVPALAKFLLHPDLALDARSAMERIPGGASLAALRKAVPESSGAIKQGLLLALGARRDAEAVPLVAAALPDRAAIAALGMIASRDALAALLAAEAGLSVDANAPWSAAVLRCADRIGDPATLEKLCDASRPRAVRTAAFIRRAQIPGDKADALLSATLAGDDETMKSAAIRALGVRPDPALLGRVATRLNEFPPVTQVQLLALIGERGNITSLPAVTQALSSQDVDVRCAALQAAGSMGDASTVPLLAALIERADGDERKRIVESLSRLRDDGANKAIVAAMEKAPAPAQCELIKSLVARNAKGITASILDAARSQEAAVRQAAIKAAGQLGDAGDAARLIALLDHADDSDRTALETALAAICQRSGDAKAPAAALPAATGTKKASLLVVLGALRGNDALVALRGALKDGDAAVRTAAVRALAEWPDGAPFDDLVDVATVETDGKARLLAIRGVAQLAPMVKDRPSKQVATVIGTVLAAATREEERQLLRSLQATLANDNLARGATATSVDGLRPDHAGRGPEAAIDGDPKTYWDETDDQKLYQIRVALKRPAVVHTIRITGFNQHSYAAKDFDVVCDDKPVKSVRAAGYTANVLTVELPPTRCATVQLNITGCYGRSPAIREFEIFGVEE